jgi:SlyX protein
MGGRKGTGAPAAREATKVTGEGAAPRTHPLQCGAQEPFTMHSNDIVDQRLTDLEVKASYTEDLLDRLNEVIVRQQAQIDQLLRDMAALRAQHSTTEPTLRSLRDELPPHY